MFYFLLRTLSLHFEIPLPPAFVPASAKITTDYRVEMERVARELRFHRPIEDAVSRIRFSPTSNNNLLISSWDSV